ncbi:MAG: hypothetical protein Q9222_004019 [Ikaeria aurantiellina]
MRQISDLQDQIPELLQRLTNTPCNGITPSSTDGEPDNTIFETSRMTDVIGKPASAQGQQEDMDTEEMHNRKETPADHVGVLFSGKGKRFLEVTQYRNREFQSLLANSEMSLQAADDQGQILLLLAAHVGRQDKVEAILAHLPSSAQTQDQAEDHRRSDIDATDSLGRTILQDCAEHDMANGASTIFDHGVDINTLDKLDHNIVQGGLWKRRTYNHVRILHQIDQFRCLNNTRDSIYGLPTLYYNETRTKEM